MKDYEAGMCMQVHEEIEYFKREALENKNAKLTITSEKMNILNQEFRKSYCEVLKDISFLEKNFLLFKHYKIKGNHIIELNKVQPIWIIPFFQINFVRYVSFYKDRNSEWCALYNLRSLSCAKLPESGIFDESVKVIDDKNGVISFLFGSERFRVLSFELCKRSCDYIAIAERNHDEIESIKNITKIIKSISIENSQITIEVHGL